MKKCIVISDSFKGTLSSVQICRIAEETIPLILPECEVVTIPIADGGEGTAECFAIAAGAELVTAEVCGPFGEKVQARYAKRGTEAVIEMASAAGLTLVEDRPDPVNAGTFGVGELMKDAVEKGCRHLIIGIGGSATNDGGCGCAAALGVRFFDRKGEEFIPVGGTLGEISRIDLTKAQEFLKETRITVMCDVDNSLCGPDGAAYVFAPQKGADAEAVKFLDDQLNRFAKILRKELGVSIADQPGSGAAGGMGAGLRAFFNARIRSGIRTFLELTEFDSLLEDTDLVLTGEGRIDATSIRGKVISGIAERTREKGIPLIAVVGEADESADELYQAGVSAIFPINRKAVCLKDAAPEAAENYKRTLMDIFRLIRVCEKW